jgi:hypothetical protein
VYRTQIKATILLLFCHALLAVNIYGQQRTVIRPPLVITNPSTKLIDEFGRLTSEERSARFDNLFHEIAQTPGSIGYVFLYCGKKCRYGEIEAHQRGIEIKIALRGFDRSRIVVLNTGFRETFETELWLATKPSDVPKPKSSVNIRLVDFTTSSNRQFEAYECCGDYSDVWKNLKP